MSRYTILSIVLLAVNSIISQVNVTTITPEIKGSGGLSLDDSGNLYIADFGDFLGAGDGDGLPNVIWELDTSLNLTEYSTDFVGASGNDFDSNGVLFQSDIGVSSIYKIIGGVRTFVTSTGISNPVGLVFDSNDNLFVCNCGNNTIRKITPSGTSTQFASGSLFFCPNGITIDEDDNLYVSNFSNGNIIKITPSGVATLLNVTPGGTTSGPSNGHLDYDPGTRTLVIASHASSKIFYLSIDNPSFLGTLAGTGVRGNTDGDVSVATFSRPNGVAISDDGDSVYINSSIPVTNTPNRPLNPSVVRLITGIAAVLSANEFSTPVNNVKTYPNPASNTFTIEADLNSDYSNITVKLYDIQGKVVKELSKIRTNNSHLKVLIDVSTLASGTYFYSISRGNDQLLFRKIVKD